MKLAVVAVLSAFLVGNVGGAGHGSYRTGSSSQSMPEQVLEQRLRDMQSVGDDVENLALDLARRAELLVRNERALNQRAAALEAREKELNQTMRLAVPESELLKLNVGGEPFQVRVQTLAPSPVLHIAATKFPKLGDGSIFVDRDPETFRVILDWLRYGELPPWAKHASASAPHAWSDAMMRKKVEHDARYFNITALQRELQQQRQLEWGDGGNTRRNSTGAGVEGERRGNGITVGSGAAAGLRRSNYTNSSDCTHISAVGDIASPSDATAIGAASDTPVAGGGPSAVVAEAAVGARADIAMASGPGKYSQLEITIGGGKLGLSFAAMKGFQQTVKASGEQSEIQKLGFFVVHVAGQCKDKGVREGDRIVRVGTTVINVHDGHTAVESLVGQLARPFTIVFERREVLEDRAGHISATRHEGQDRDPAV